MKNSRIMEYMNLLIITKISINPLKDKILSMPVPHIKPSELTAMKPKINKVIIINAVPKESRPSII